MEGEYVQKWGLKQGEGERLPSHSPNTHRYKLVSIVLLVFQKSEIVGHSEPWCGKLIRDQPIKLSTHKTLNSSKRETRASAGLKDTTEL